jgi:hypothetical protein
VHAIKRLHPRHAKAHIQRTWRRGFWYKLLLCFSALLILWFSTLFGISQWYIASNRDKPYNYGVTFIPGYAEYFGLNPKETMQAMIDELGVRQFRLVSYWDVSEATQGTYDFSQLDWQFEKANAVGAKVSLAIGLRQPRWPECHMPAWAESQPMSVWLPELKKYMQATIERYKNNPALDSYQLENEFFMTVFGICPDHSRERLVDEYNFVKSLDSEHPVIVSRSNNWIGIPIHDPRPDEFGISVYKRVWDKTFTKRYFEYPLPDWFYGMLAGAGKIVTGKDMVIHELQAEPWLPDGYAINDLGSLSEQDKSMNAERLHGRFEYAKGTGMHEAYLWGAEWWYWRKVKAHDPSDWDAAREEFTAIQKANQKLQ